MSLPFELRVPLAYHHDLTLAVHAVAARAIEGWYRAQGRVLGIADGRTGSITAVQRFGASPVGSLMRLQPPEDARVLRVH